MTKEKIKSKLLPVALLAFIVIADQVTKLVVTKTIPYGTVGVALGGDLLRIVHVANTGVAFSVGSALPGALRRALFAFIPLAVIVLAMAVYFRSDAFTRVQNWCICGIIGGGIGNLADRFFRARGVVDFIDVKFFGLLGLERWPTFNVADASIVVCGIVLLVSFFFETGKKPR